MPIIVEEDKEYEAIFIDGAINLYQENNKKRATDGLLHIGDITYCARKAWIPYVFPSQNILDIYEVNNFMRGLGIEHAVVTVLNHIHKDVIGDFQKELLLDNIVGHPDFKLDDVIFEIKSTNKIDALTIKSDNLKSYIRQVVYYMILTGIETGRIVISLNLPFHMTYERNQARTDDNPNYLYRVKYHHKNNKIPYFFVKVTIPKEDPLRVKVFDILTTKIRPLYDHVINEGDLTVIPVLDIKEKGGWQCTSCKHRKFCDMIPDKQHDEELRGVLLNKFIDDEVVNPIVEKMERKNKRK